MQLAPDGHRRQQLAAAALLASLVALAMLPALPAHAQLFGNDPQPRRQQQSRDPFINPFQWFGPRQQYERRREPQRQVDYSKAPPPEQRETEPTRKIVVLGSSMADWLAYGLEQAFADEPDTGIVRKHRTGSGLIHYLSRKDNGWAEQVAEALKDLSPVAIVMMVGLYDRQSMREAEPAEPKPGSNAGQESKSKPEKKRRAPQSHEFRSEKWAELYEKRIDDTIAVLKRKGVPVVWVGLPAVLGTRSTSDMLYLNNLFRTRAERAGIVYVDVWDGFVAESGRYSSYGPDVDGQRRRLRSGDGVFFTQHGARKLAHYVERDLRRVIGTRPFMISLPSPEDGVQSDTAKPGAPVARPLAGPIVPLTASAGGGELLGGASARSTATDPVAVRVLLKGEAVAAPEGRADDFSWKAGGVTPPASDASTTGETKPREPVGGVTAVVAPVSKAAKAATPKRPTAAVSVNAAAPSNAAPAKAAIGSTPGTAETSPEVAPLKPAEKPAEEPGEKTASTPTIIQPEPVEPPRAAVEQPKPERPAERAAVARDPVPPRNVERRRRAPERRDVRRRQEPDFNPLGFLFGDQRR